MTKYLISFPSEAMVLTDEEFPIVAAAANAVIEEAKAAGVYVYAGGIEEKVDPVLVSADGEVTAEIYPGSRAQGRASRCWNFRRARTPSSGRGRSRSPAVAPRNSARSGKDRDSRQLSVRNPRQRPQHSEVPGPGPTRTGCHPRRTAGWTRPYRVDAP